MANKSKAKGKAFERELVGILNETFGLNFQRVPNSGAFLGGLNQFRYDQMSDEQKLLHDGDIIVPKELSHISFEAKNYKDFSFHALFSGKNALLDGWLKQASHTKKPYYLLFFKITHKDTFVTHLKEYNLQTGENKMIYKDKFLIELAKPFLQRNKETLLDLQYCENIGGPIEL